jgi:hypothetical protein
MSNLPDLPDDPDLLTGDAARELLDGLFASDNGNGTTDSADDEEAGSSPSRH